MRIPDYVQNINARYRTGISTEHSYRGDLQTLIESILSGYVATNEPKRIACGAPDYILTQNDIPIGYIEAKDIGVTLNGKDYKDQFKRYRKSLNNLIFTDYLDFHYYKDGELISTIRIGEIIGNKIRPLNKNFEPFLDLLKEFSTHITQTITSSSKLSIMMAGKARLLERVIESALTSDEENEENSSMKDQMEAFRKILIHDITPKEFADIYAQTVAYGMFAARLHDPSLDTFSRQEAAELIPKSNPFLRKLFQHIAGYDLDDRIKWIIDGLADVFKSTDVAKLLKDIGKTTGRDDPIIHFYETFLAEYDPKLRKSRGVYYTPEPVVNFIVRAVDDILKTEFGLSQGLADTTKTKIQIKVPTHDKRSKGGLKKVEQSVHKVQILDPATGTGTFLTEVVKKIYQKFKGQEGIWTDYVEKHLIPRLNGFELLMASYAMAHLKLELLLSETGFKPIKEQRLRVYLTNSLEEHHPDTGTIFSNWLSTEANEANHVKRDSPIMCVIGNPPYSVSSSNASVSADGVKTWIGALLDDYKEGLNERKLNLDDDYIKFLRYGQYLIDKNGEGILAFISNNSFIDGVTHRKMRSELLNSFNKIYILDLHGSYKKIETTSDGDKDENVFDIQQGVSINIFIKTDKNKSEISELLHFDLYGNRNQKYSELFGKKLSEIKWDILNPKEPYHFFVPKDFKNEKEYNNFFSLTNLFYEVGSGMKTERDRVCIQFTKKEMRETVDLFNKGDEEEIRNKYNLTKDSRDWKLDSAIKDIQENYQKNLYQEVHYRPFDVRWCFYTGKSRGFIGTPAPRRMKNLIDHENLSLVVCRQQSTFDFQHSLISNLPSDICYLSSQTKETAYVIPLYLYSNNSNQKSIDSNHEKIPNLKADLIKVFSEKIGIDYSSEIKKDESYFSPIDIMDYVYAILYSLSYRKRYKEFLKISFPKIPYPKGRKSFWKLVELGKELRLIHLFSSQKIDEYLTQYPKYGDNIITKRISKNNFEIIDPEKQLGKIMINNEQFFKNVPITAWEFWIGGYQPAQKWLKDRYGRQLSFEDIGHYQKIIVAITETDRIMKEIDNIDFL